MPLFGEDVLDAIQTPEGIARLMRGAPPVTDVLSHLQTREGIARLLGRPESDLPAGSNPPEATPLPAGASGSITPAAAALAPAQPQAAAASTPSNGLINSTLAGIGPGINQAAEEGSALRPGWQGSVGGIRVGPEMSGRDVLARTDLTPASRAFFERAETGRDTDRRNPVIASLGGPQGSYGESGVIPTISQASARLGRDLSPAEYTAMLRGGGDVQSQQANTALDTRRLTDPAGGTLAVNAAGIENNRLSTQQDAQRAAFQREFLNNPANGRTPAERWTALQALMRSMGMPRAGFTVNGSPLPGTTPAPEEFTHQQGSAGLLPQGAEPLPRPPGMNAGPTGGGASPAAQALIQQLAPQSERPTPEASLNAAYGTVEDRYSPQVDQHGHHGAIPDNKQADAITDMIHDLRANRPDINGNQIAQFIIAKMGSAAFDKWFGAAVSGVSLNPFSQHDRHAQAYRALQGVQ